MTMKATVIILVPAMIQTVTITTATMAAAVVATTPDTGAVPPKLIIPVMSITAMTSRVADDGQERSNCQVQQQRQAGRTRMYDQGKKSLKASYRPPTMTWSNM